MTTITITQLEETINHWRTAQTNTDAVHTRQARVLADLYGQMIFEHRTTVTEADLTEAQREAIRAALPNSF
jgi:hypothetical protein